MEVLRDMLEQVIVHYCNANNVEVDQIKVYGYFDRIDKKIKYAIKVDVREPGQIMFGA